MGQAMKEFMGDEALGLPEQEAGASCRKQQGST